MSNKISSVTRRHILEAIISTPYQWHGRLNEVDFLSKFWPLESLPSQDGRFKNMAGDVFQHRINNDDYEVNWFITDSRLNILDVDDDVFFRFLTEMLHPIIVENHQARDCYLSIINANLINDGYCITPSDYISGEPVYVASQLNLSEITRNLLTKLVNGCIAISTDGTFSDAEYESLKQQLRKQKEVYQLLPDFIRSSNRPLSIRTKLQSLYKSYKERREHIDSEFCPVFTYLDNLSGVVDPFSDTTDIENGELIGQGGFGLVYKIKHKYLDLSFAVKVFKKHPFSIGKHDSERFFKEAKILFHLDHPNIIKIYDVGVYNGDPFIKMEFFEGHNLNQIFQKHGILAPNKAIALVKSIAEGLEYAFSNFGVVHRDLRPANIMASKPEKFKIIDFGLSVYIEDELRTRLTETGEIVSSGVYSAPELLNNPKLVDVRCDIYSLGAIWYECLLGRPPQGSGIAEVLHAKPSIPDEHKRIILKMLHSDPTKRYASWEAVINDITV